MSEIIPKIKKKSNTLILTDTTLLHPKNASPLAETLNTLKSFVNEQSVKNGVHICLQILHFRSFRRILMIFSFPKIAELVHEYFDRLGIKVGFARRDNIMGGCDINDNCELNKPSVADRSETILEPNSPSANESIDERYPGDSTFSDTSPNKLEVPNPPIQMQSPPPSPYEGWIERPEDPPSDTTIGFHPKTLGHLLYTYDNEGSLNGSQMKKVFSSVIESKLPDEDHDEELEDFDIGEGLSDDEKKLEGSLFHSTILRKGDDVIGQDMTQLKVPIVVVDQYEADHLRQHAAEMDKRLKK